MGRPKIKDEDKKISLHITVSPEHAELLKSLGNGNSSKGVAHIIEKESRVAKQVALYCQYHLDQMWAAAIVGIVFDCDFRDCATAIDKYFSSKK